MEYRKFNNQIVARISASADVKHYLTVTDGEVIDAMRFGKAVGTEIICVVPAKLLQDASAMRSRRK